MVNFLKRGEPIFSGIVIAMRQTLLTGNMSYIKPVRFQQEIAGVTQLISEGFQPVLSAEGIDFQEYLKISRRSYVPFLMSPLHPLVSRFFEVFVWVHENELVGTGTVQRLHFNDKAKWVLSNFAVSRKRTVNFATVVTMRSLMRRAITHALLNGANEILAHVREDNEAVYTLCKGEGFEVIGEDSYYLLSPAQTRVARQGLHLHAGITVSKPESDAIEAIFGFIIRQVFGFQKSIYLAQFEHNPIAKIQLTNHPGSISAYQMEIRPLVDISPELAYGLIAHGLLTASYNGKRRVLIAFPTAHTLLKQTMEQYEIPEVFRRKCLILRTERLNSSRTSS